MIVQTPEMSDADYYRKLDYQLERYEHQKGRYAGIRATEVQREMRALWARMDEESKAAVKTWREEVAS